MSTTMIDTLSSDFVIDYENKGLNLAISFTAFDGSPEVILDKSYGELVFNAYEWGID